MSPKPDQSEVSVLARALHEMKRLRAVIESRNEPVAIVGMACRFPGADNPREFWRLLHDGTDAIRTVPPERWDVDEWYDPNPDTPGKSYTRSGGFLDGIDLFDAALFRISAREAASMDPQHRVLLETAWQALEDAGIVPGGPAAARTGVFVGITTNDYLHLQIEQADRTSFDAYTATGNPLNFAAGRLSYVFGFQGPCMAVDAACASSLVSVHLACQSLRGRECDTALAAGVSLLLSPQGSVFLSKTRALSPDGRCKTFDAAADGMSRAEGCGVVVLKRLPDAVRDGDRILGCIRGSAVGQDGPSSGLTAPNGHAQQSVIRAALQNAGVRPADVSYVEAHGTGTPLGDPIEVRALAAVFCEGRDPARPLAVGSVKTNIGHPEAAAGIAGLFKTVLALRHEEIPPHLHLRTLTPHVDWDRIPVRIPVKPEPWLSGGTRRLAGVSAFGLSGTLAHVVLEEAPESPGPAAPGPDRPCHVLALSAKSDEALAQLAVRYRDFLAEARESFADICFSANTGRAQFSHRLAIVAGSAAEAREKLTGFTPNAETPAAEPALGFLFTGGGLPDSVAGRSPYEREPVFRKAMDRCAGVPGEKAALFALEYALSELWRSWGVQPRTLAGYGVGEFAAACSSGMLSPQEALSLIASGVPLPAEKRLCEEACEIVLEIGGRGEWEEMLTSLASLWVQGIEVQWDAFDRGYPRRRIALPTYPFQRKRYWFEAALPVRKSLQSDWLYAVSWERKAPGAEALRREGTWTILGDRSGLGEQLAERLGKSRVLLVPPGSRLPDLSRGRAVIYLGGLDAAVDEDCEVGARDCCATALRVVQAMANSEGPGSPRLWFVTRAPEGQCIAQSVLSGLGKVVGVEHPGLWGGLIDLDVAGTADDAVCLQRELELWDGEAQVRYRGGDRYVARLTRLKDAPAASGGILFKQEASYLITGGFGALGLRLARWMVNRGARRLILMGRRPPSSDALAAIAGLERAGARILAVQGDVSRRDELDAALQKTGSTAELKGVFHAAGVLADGVLTQQTMARFEQALAPKVGGTWNLHRATLDCKLDFFVLFSSASALFGSPGQGNYAAANAFLDAFAEFRQGQGLPAVSVNWGPWAEAGMAAAAGSTIAKRVWEGSGISAIPPDTGFEFLGRILDRQAARAAVLPIDWNLFADRFPEGGLRLFISSLTGGAQPAAAPAQPVGDLRSRIQATEGEVRVRLLIDYLRGRLSEILHAEAKDFPGDQNLVDTGIDSLMVMEFLNSLKRDLGLTVYPREFYERPTIGELARYLAAEVSGTDTVGGDTVLSIGSAIRPFRAPDERLPGIVFLLSSPRAGSTLLRVMLAGHPALFCPPELHLLPFDTMAERGEALASSYLGEGLQRAFMELDAIGAEESKALVKGFAEAGHSSQGVYGLLQERCPGRLLVDKSPSYAASPETLARAEALFDRPRYIHLIRHPYAVIESFVRNRFQRLIPSGNGDAYDLAEQVWTACNDNVLRFLQPLDPARRHVVRYEELVADPAQVMRRLCDFLDIPFDERVLKPYEGNRMTDGIHAQSLSIGDPGFLDHRTIEQALGDAWKAVRLPRRLSAAAQRVAAQLEYSLPAEASPCAPRRERFLDVRGLRLCICEWGPSDGDPILCLHGILDQAASWEPVAQDLAQRGFRVIAPDLRGHGLSGHASGADSYHLLDFLADIDAVARDLGERPFRLVGHSMGAALAAMFAGARPTSVARLVLIECPSPAGEQRKDVAKMMATQLDYLAAPSQHAVLPDVAAAAARLRQATPSLSDDLAGHLAIRITEPYENGIRWRWDARLQTRAGISFQGIDTLNLSGYLETLRRIEAPVTLVYADSSNFVRAEQMAAIEQALGMPERFVLPGGHNLHVDAAPAVADLISR